MLPPRMGGGSGDIDNRLFLSHAIVVSLFYYDDYEVTLALNTIF